MSEPRRGLLRILGSWEGAAVSIGVAIGAGIFRTPGEIAGYLSRPAAILGVWAFGALVVLLDATVLAELAAMRPRAGGHYAYLRDAFGDRAGFLFAWAASFLSWPASVAALMGIGGEYALRLGLPATPGALAILLVPTGLHALGIRTGARAQDLLSYGKALGLVVFAALALWFAGDAGPEVPSTPVTLAGLGLALQGVLWSYDGYADAVLVGEEVKDPGRALPRALLLSVVILTFVYLLLNLAFLACLSPGEMAASNLVAADAALRLGGPPARRLVEMLAWITVFGGASATLLSGPRISYALARDGMLFPAFTRVNRGGTPIVALLVMALTAFVYWWANTWNQIVSMTIFVIYLFVGLTAGALFVFRRREPEAARPYRVPLYPLPPLLLLAVTIGLLADLVAHQPREALQGCAVLALGLIAYEIWRRRRPRPPRPGDHERSGAHSW